jgi:PAS domain-containing protein
MRALARVRTKAAKLRGGRAGDSDACALLDETLELTDAMRVECAGLQQQILDLQGRLQMREREVQELIDRLPAALVLTDGAGIIADANHAATTMFGLGRAGLKHELLLHFAEDRPGFADLLRRLPHGGEPIRAIARIRPRNRAPFDADITLLKDPREAGARWLWFFDRVSALQSAGRIRAPRAAAPSQSDSSAH